MEKNVKWKIPHVIKIPEAFSALTDERYEEKGKFFYVYSSNRARKYRVTVYEDGYASNDNMSYNQNILGYPVVLHLMLKKKISYDAAIAKLFKNINWTELNLACKKDFDASYHSVLQIFSENGLDAACIDKEVQSAYSQLKMIIPMTRRYKSEVTFEESLLMNGNNNRKQILRF